MSRHILLAIVGSSPQVITETLCMLFAEGKPVNQIIAITTTHGRDITISKLLSDTDGKFFQFVEDYSIEKNTINFDKDNIIVPKDEQGKELEDITTEDESEIFLKSCLSISADLTRDNTTNVSFSISGGRKTMSACMSFAAQVYARPQDRLYHVIVSPDFEKNHGYYYPPPDDLIIPIIDQRGEPSLKSTIYAQPCLISVPFFSIRRFLDTEDLYPVTEPGTLMGALLKDEKVACAVIISRRVVTYRGKECDLPPAHFALYRYLVEKYLEGETVFYAEKILDNELELNRVYRGGKVHQMTLSREVLNSYRSKINSRFRKAFGVHAEDISIQSRKDSNGIKYFFNISSKRMKIS